MGNTPAEISTATRPSRASPFRQLGARAINLMFPSVCMACRASVADPDTVCTTCWQGI
ncbi:MAG: double zinc ribbon domain-containing protein, partial [Hyphomicrobiaceae bacterium]|nr:double zinc ribbon domain-containing protein [Hyphomicrobiaceae bacterium]